MKIFKTFMLLALVISTSACSTKFKALSEDYADQKLNTKAKYYNPNKVRAPYAQQTVVSAPGGLVGLLVLATATAAINANSKVQAVNRSAKIADSLNGFNFKRYVENPTVSEIKKASWLNVGSVERIQHSFNPVSADNIIANIDKPYFLSVAYDYAVLSDDNFQNTMFLKLYDTEMPKDPIYKFTLTESYFIPGSGLFDGEQEGSWEHDNGKFAKEAVKVTTQKLLERMRLYLENPFDKTIQSRVHPVGITKEDADNKKDKGES